MKNLILLLLISVAYFSRGQQSGYVITAEQDSLRGNFLNTEWFNSPEEISFVSEEGNNFQFSPSEILRFKVGSDIYYAAKTQIETSSRQDADLSYGNELQLEEIEVFLKEEINGPISLLSARLSSIPHYFVLKDGTIEPLYYKRFKEVRDDEEYVAESNRFRNQLSYFFGQDCNTIGTQTRYMTSSLVKAFQKHYKCIGFEPAMPKKEKERAKVGIIGGLAISALPIDINSSEIPDFVAQAAAKNISEGNYSSLGPVVGIVYEMPLSSRNSSLVFDLRALTFSSSAVQTTSTATREVTSDFTYEETVLRFGGAFKNKLTKKGNFFFQLGPIFSFALKNEAIERRVVENTLSSESSNLVVEDFEDILDIGVPEVDRFSEPDYKAMVFGGRINLSYEFKKMLFGINYSINSDFAADQRINATRRDFSLTLTYLL